MTFLAASPHPPTHVGGSRILADVYISLYIWESQKKPGVLKWRKQKDVPEEKKLVWVEVGTLYGH